MVQFHHYPNSMITLYVCFLIFLPKWNSDPFFAPSNVLMSGIFPELFFCQKFSRKEYGMMILRYEIFAIWSYNQDRIRAYNSRVEYTSDKRAVGSSSLPRLRFIFSCQFWYKIWQVFSVTRWCVFLCRKTGEKWLSGQRL